MLQLSPVKKSALQHKQLAMGAHMVERDGWRQPAFYSSVDQESLLLNTGVGVYDISASGKLLLQGNDLACLLRNIFSADEAPAVGEVRRLSRPARGRLARLTADEYLLLCDAAELPKWTVSLGESPPDCVHVFDHTSGLAGVRLTGPKSDELLSKLSELDTSPATFPNLHCAQTKCAEIHGTLIRTDLGPLPSYDLYFSREFGEYMWEAIFHAGEEFGAAAVGFEAADRSEQSLD